ncbi:hypothetical protein TRFO_17238 [Tritrichomonas foetus]|uniref:Uncharacterized protein n=1 Tax=Tritrichomonas foetus TaxID=1144522 RepID=A0A1J4KSZ7_9EUKA|nr:hypothetical protein TRFO_17238 [Tritrichomonas foetus]|eukprot:OHT12782.1 hypothetical protein TRFO_17238 [Tritrichomonas foetus]
MQGNVRIVGRSTPKSARGLTDKIKSQIDHYSEEIVRLQKENIDINSENQRLANRYSQLTTFNQELGNDLANFDSDIEMMERQIIEKNLKYQKLSNETNALHQDFEKYRKKLLEGNENTPAYIENKIKRLESKKQSLLQNFQELENQKVDVEGIDVLKERSEILNRVKSIEEHNDELTFQIKILKVLLDDAISNEEKEEFLENALKQKKEDNKQIKKDLKKLKKKTEKRQKESGESSKSNKSKKSTKDKNDSDDQNNENQDNTIHSNSQKKSLSQISSSKSGKTSLVLVRPFQNDKSKSDNIVIKSNRKDKQDYGFPKTLPELQLKKEGQTDVMRHRNSDINQDMDGSSSFFSPRYDSNKPKSLLNLSSSSKTYRENEQTKIDVDIQSNYLSGKSAETEELEKLEQENQKVLKNLKKEIRARKDEKKTVEAELCGFKQNFSISDKKSFTIYADPLAHITQSQWLRSIHNQTDVTGETIDFHLKILTEQEKNRETAEITQKEIKILQEKIQDFNSQIEHAKIEGERRDQAIQKVQHELHEVQARANGSKQQEDLEMRMKLEIVTDIKRLKNDIRTKQALLQSTHEENKKANEHLEELIHRKNELEHDIEELAFKERPQIEELSDKVTNYQQRVSESKIRLEKAKRELNSKREELENLRTSKEHDTYKKLFLRKKTMERRIIKWKILLKDSSETLQSLEQFSTDNSEKRKNLKDMVERYENIRFDKEEELQDTEQYSLLLEALLTEQKNNWS